MRLEETPNIQTIHANLVRVIERKNLRYINWLKSTRIEKGSRAISTSIVSYRSSQLKKEYRTWTGVDPRPGGGGGGVLGISSDGDDRMEPKDKTQKIPGPKINSQKIQAPRDNADYCITRATP